MRGRVEMRVRVKGEGERVRVENEGERVRVENEGEGEMVRV